MANAQLALAAMSGRLPHVCDVARHLERLQVVRQALT
jgi:hypothetical protein